MLLLEKPQQRLLSLPKPTKLPLGAVGSPGPEMAPGFLVGGENAEEIAGLGGRKSGATILPVNDFEVIPQAVFLEPRDQRVRMIREQEFGNRA